MPYAILIDFGMPMEFAARVICLAHITFAVHNGQQQICALLNAF
jgi:hypothetical protein